MELTISLRLGLRERKGSGPCGNSVSTGTKLHYKEGARSGEGLAGCGVSAETHTLGRHWGPGSSAG